LLIVGLILALVITVVPMVGMGWISMTEVKDKILRASLDQEGIWHGWEHYIGLTILASTLVSFGALLTRSSKTLWIGMCLSLLSISSVLIVIVPKVEAHTQNGIIRFYQEHTDAHFYTYKFKSYAHYFYGETELLMENDTLKQLRSEFYEEKDASGMIDLLDSERHELSTRELEFVASGKYNKPVRIICQVNKVDELRKREDLRELHPDGYSLGAYHIFVPK